MRKKSFAVVVLILVATQYGCNKFGDTSIQREEVGQFLFIEMNHTSGPKKTIRINTNDVPSAFDEVKIWNSEDGTKCDILTRPLMAEEGNYAADFNCNTSDGWKIQTVIACNKHMGKDNSIYIFIGGINKYNQNFVIWCQ